MPQMLISNRLRQAMIRDARFRHADGTPNKRAFARALQAAAGQNGDGDDLASWERKVYRWTSEKDPGGMNDASAELAAEVLGISVDELKIRSLLEASEAQSQETGVLLQQLLGLVESLDRRLQRLEGDLLGPRDAG